MAKRVGVVGCGIMGGGMAGRLLRQGFAVVVYNRTAEKLKPLVEAGAVTAGSPAELAAQVDTAIVMVRDDASVRETILGERGVLSGARPGTTVINTSTVTPALALELGPAVEQRGCKFLDAPVTGSRVAARDGMLGILASGADEVIEEQRDVFGALGYLVKFGALGTSATFKLANNQLAGVVMRAMGESIALCEEGGLDRTVVVEALTTTLTRIGALNKEKLIQRDWSVDFALSLMLKDLDESIDTAESLGVAVPLAESAREIYRRAVRDGMGALHFGAVTEAE